MDSDDDSIPPPPRPAFRKKPIKRRRQYKEERIEYYLLWNYTITKTRRTPKEVFHYPKRQTSILEYMILPYNILWYRGLDIFAHKDYLTNEQEEVEALKDEEGWFPDDNYQDYFDEVLYGHDFDCFFSEYREPGLCAYYWEMEDEYGESDTRFYNALEAIVDDFIEMKPQPYERFELAVFCLRRIRDCNRFFEHTFHNEYAKILIEFTQFKCSQIKDELLAAVYHPDRMMRLIARGYKDDIVKCYGS